MIRVTTQAQAKQIRDRLDLCYLCLKPLPEQRLYREPKRNVVTEHVIPRAFRGRSRRSSDWSPVLDVHPTCEASLKAPVDDFASSFRRIHTLELEAPQAKGLQRRGLHEIPGDSPVFGGGGDLFRSIRWTVRGLVYMVQSAPLTGIEWIYAPVPHWGTSEAASEIQWRKRVEELTASIDNRLAVSAWGGVTCWGGRVRFQLVELRKDEMFAWRLVFPGVRKLSRIIARETGFLPASSEWQGIYRRFSTADAVA